jgi:hypothetical protein|tara:strand:+ start:1586 stop:2413 length:828 start_codon:yes stop_codon:yes gene_type:complete
MIRLINLLSTNRIYASVSILVYFALVIFPHEWVGVNINALFSSMPRSTYNLIILICFLCVLFGIGFFISKKLLVHPERNLLMYYLALTLALIYIVNSTLFVVNIESVHYIQYGVGAILLFGLIRQYYVVLFIAFLISLFDEGYQYFYLSPQRTDYFDINDIITDFLGTAFGLIILRIYSLKSCGDSNLKFKWRGMLLLIVGIVSLLAAIRSDFLSVFPSQDNYMLVRKMQEGFWTTVNPNVTFHVVGPIEGLLILFFLFFIYYFCFRVKSEELVR